MRGLSEIMAGGPVLTDGAWGTRLQARGLPIGACPDRWNIERPGAVLEVAREYVEAGSRVILTNTFRANRVALADYGLAADAAAINREGVAISRHAALGRARVFASMGPTGKLLAAGEISAEDIYAAFAEQAQALAEAGADALLIETMSDAEEATLALEASRLTALPVIVSFSFDSGRNKDRTMTGLTPEQAVARMSDAGVDAVGANCGVGIAEYVAICKRLRAFTELPLWIKANAGMPEMENGRARYHITPGEFASHIPALAEAGANFIGGCCGTGPDFIRAAVTVLEKVCG